jgi:hypothetical protein
MADYQDLPTWKYPRGYSKEYEEKLRDKGRGYGKVAPDWAYSPSEKSDEVTKGERKVEGTRKFGEISRALTKAMSESEDGARKEMKRKRPATKR